MYPRDNDWKKLITKHKRAIDDFRKNNKDLPSKVEDELLGWASQTGEVSGKHDAEDFIMSILDESTISEAKNLMPAIQKIVDEKGAAKVGGVMVDMFTASVLTQAYGKVNDSNKKKMESSNIQTLVKLAQRVMGMKESLDEEVIVYKVKGIQKPETEKFQSSGGAMNYAIKQIEKFKKGFSKKKEVQKALQYANEEVKYKLNVGVVFTEDTHPCKGLSEDDPCWKNYKQVGMKKKNGKEVPKIRYQRRCYGR